MFTIYQLVMNGVRWPIHSITKPKSSILPAMADQTWNHQQYELLGSATQFCGLNHVVCCIFQFDTTQFDIYIYNIYIYIYVCVGTTTDLYIYTYVNPLLCQANPRSYHCFNGHVRNLNPRHLPYVRECPHKIWSYMVQYLHFRILKFPAIVFP